MIWNERLLSALEDTCIRIVKYQLILQFVANSLQDFDFLVALEDQLIEELDEFAKVDGHDFGSGEFNIFILTDDPVAVFDKAHETLIKQGVPNVFRSAYHTLDREDYVILWPSSLRQFRVH